MMHKYGKWYARWTDAHGARHVKALPSKKAARAYASRMTKEAQAGKAQRARRSAKSHARGKQSPAPATRA